MSSESLILRVFTPEGTILEADSLSSVNVPLADDCPIGIRPGHAPLIAETKKGIVHYRGQHQEEIIQLHAGILEIRDNEIIILTSGEVSTISPEITQPTELEYERLMKTLVEKLSLDQD